MKPLRKATIFYLCLVIALSLNIASGSTDILKVCFHTSEANERGTAGTMYDFADFAEKILAYRSHIILPNPNVTGADTASLQMFLTRFPVTFYIPNAYRGSGLGRRMMKAGGTNLPKHAISVGCDVMYTTKSGT